MLEIPYQRNYFLIHLATLQSTPPRFKFCSACVSLSVKRY